MDEDVEVGKSIRFYLGNKNSYLAQTAEDAMEFLETPQVIEAVIMDCQSGTHKVLEEAQKNNIPCYLYTVGPNNLLSETRNKYLQIDDLQQEYKDTIKGVFLKPGGLYKLDQKIQKQRNKNP